MDKDRFDYLVEYTRHRFIDYEGVRWKPPAEAWAYNYKMLSEHGDAGRELLRELIVDSEKTKMAWDSVSLIAREHLREGSALPPELRDWVDDVLAGKRPQRKEGKRTNSRRNRMVFIAIDHLVRQFGLLPMRNISQTIDGKKSDWPHCCPEGGSACDVVGKALGGLGYKAIERCWTSKPFSTLF